MFTTTISGNLTAQPELKTTQEGRTMVDFDVAVNRRRKTSDGQYVDAPTTFIAVRAFGQLAENLALLGKGRAVLITGELVTDEWTADGQKRTKDKILATAAGPDFTRARITENANETLYQPKPDNE